MRRSPAVLTAALATVAFAGVAYLGTLVLTLPDPESPNAARVRDAYWWVYGYTMFVFVAVEAALVAFIIRFRRRRRARTAEGPQIRGNTNLETGWTVVPVLILAAIGAFIFYKLPGIKNIPSATASGGRLDVRVEGHLFYWNFKYPNGAIAVDRLRVPAGRVVATVITAPAYGVNHSFWVPKLGGKFDAIPGEENRTWFRADEPGRYKGYCAEFCGVQHAQMHLSVEVLPRQSYEAWVERRASRAGDADLGRETWEGACAKCHGPKALGGYGPNIAVNPSLRDADQLEQIVRQGRGRMPAVGRNWSERQMKALTDYARESIAESGGGSGG